MKPDMVRQVMERAKFVKVESRAFGKWWGARLYGETVYFARRGSKGCSWLITRGDVDEETPLVSYYFKIQRQRFVKMPDDVTQALILKAWPRWVPDL